MKMYEKYNYGFFVWFLFEVFGQWGVLIVYIMMTFYNVPINRMFLNIKEHFIFYLVLTPFVSWFFYLGYYQHSIRAITVGIWSTIVTPVGIYGKRFWEKVLFFLPYRLLARWEDIERVEYHRSSYSSQDHHIGFIRVIRKDGKKFSIIFRTIAPYSWSGYGFRIEEHEKGSNKGVVSELVGIIAWKVGINKLIGFPEEEKISNLGKRTRILAYPTISQVVSEIKKGSSFLEIDKEYEGIRDKGSIKDKIYLWELDAMENPYR